MVNECYVFFGPRENKRERKQEPRGKIFFTFGKVERINLQEHENFCTNAYTTLKKWCRYIKKSTE